MNPSQTNVVALDHAYGRTSSQGAKQGSCSFSARYRRFSLVVPIAGASCIAKRKHRFAVAFRTIRTRRCLTRSIYNQCPVALASPLHSRPQLAKLSRCVSSNNLPGSPVALPWPRQNNPLSNRRASTPRRRWRTTGLTCRPLIQTGCTGS